MEIMSCITSFLIIRKHIIYFTRCEAHSFLKKKKFYYISESLIVKLILVFL